MKKLLFLLTVLSIFIGSSAVAASGIDSKEKEPENPVIEFEIKEDETISPTSIKFEPSICVYIQYVGKYSDGWEIITPAGTMYRLPNSAKQGWFSPKPSPGRLVELMLDNQNRVIGWKVI